MRLVMLRPLASTWEAMAASVIVNRAMRVTALLAQVNCINYFEIKKTTRAKDDLPFVAAYMFLLLEYI